MLPAQKLKQLIVSNTFAVCWATSARLIVPRTLQLVPVPDSPCVCGRVLRATRPLHGVREWLDTLGRFNVPCALVSALDRQTVQAALARMTLHDHFQVSSFWISALNDFCMGMQQQ